MHHRQLETCARARGHAAEVDRVANLASGFVLDGRFDQCPDFAWEGRLEGDFFAFHYMVHGQSRGVKRLPRKDQALPVFFGQLILVVANENVLIQTVHLVPDNGVSDMSHVHTYLVCSTRLQRHFYMAGAG